MPAIAPCAMMGAVSPQPPYAACSPTTCLVSSRTHCMSSTFVPRPCEVMYRPFRLSIRRPSARKRTSVLSRRGSPMMTAAPPPKLSPAAAAL